jgi:hypothetical protein
MMTDTNEGEKGEKTQRQITAAIMSSVAKCMICG